MEYTFDTLPQAVSALADELREIKRLLLESNNKDALSDKWFDLDDLVAYDPEKRSKHTFYGYIYNRSIPFHKRGKKVTFLKSEIDAWLKEGRKMTLSEIEGAASNSIIVRRAQNE